MLNAVIQFMVDFLLANTAGVTNFLGQECVTNLEWIFCIAPIYTLIPTVFTIMMIVDSPEEFPTLNRILDWALTYKKK